MGLHVAAVGALLVRHEIVEARRADPIMVTMLPERRAEAAPQVEAGLEEIRYPAPVVPVISIDIPVEAPRAITVASKPAPAPPAPPSDADAPIMATSVEYVRPPVVRYPASARQARATGTVQVRALVELDGHVRTPGCTARAVMRCLTAPRASPFSRRCSSLTRRTVCRDRRS